MNRPIDQRVAQFTPGPWVVSDYGISSADGYNDVARAADGHVYDEYDSDPATVEIANQANARLIAAAPDLYEALEIAAALIGAPSDFRGLEDDDEVEHCVNVRIGHVKQFRAALRKARGEQA